MQKEEEEEEEEEREGGREGGDSSARFHDVPVSRGKSCEGAHGGGG